MDYLLHAICLFKLPEKHEMVANKWTKNVLKWVIYLMENISWRNIITLRYSIQIVTYFIYRKIFHEEILEHYLIPEKLI